MAELLRRSTGTQGGTATAVLIDGAPVSGTTVTLVNKITVDTGGSIFATATVTDPASTAVTQLVAIGIEDRSNSLANINNFGTISAQTTILTNGHTAIAHAVDVSLNTIGLDFENKGTVIGDVLFGTGDSSYVLTGSGSGIGQVASHTGAINFAGGNDNLTLNSFSNVAGAITSQGTLTVSVADHATLAVQNVVTGSGTNLLVKDFTTTGGNLSTVDLSVTSGLATRALIEATGTIAFSPGTNLGITYGSFIPAGGTFMLLSAPTGNLSITPGDLANYNLAVGGATSIPFLFNSASLAINPIGGNDVLELTVVPKTQTQLGLSGYAVQMFPLANVAISSDDALGAALVAGINSQADAQKVYSAFAPDVSGGTRAVAISITDQATGVVSARQRQLRLFSKEPGELTLWGNEFGEYLSTHGQTKRGVDGVTLPTGTCTTSCPSVTLNGFKDHGFGFSLGLDSGAPEDGWYGAAFTFYTGDVQAGSGTTAPTSKTGELWYLLTGYTDWRGRGLFVDSQVSVGYGQLKGKRFLDLTVPVAGTTNTTTFSREADSNRAALVGTLGLTTGALMKFGSTFFTPQLSIDGLTMREEGYTEINGGTGFDLAVKPYYANSLRAFLGTEVRQDINLGDFFLQPSARVGYRFDFLNDPTKLRAQFSDSNTATLGTNPGTPFTIRGPDPSRGNIVGGLNLNATTDNWTIGLSYDASTAPPRSPMSIASWPLARDSLEDETGGQNDLFSGAARTPPPIELRPAKPWVPTDRLSRELEAVGFFSPAIRSTTIRRCSKRSAPRPGSTSRPRPVPGGSSARLPARCCRRASARARAATPMPSSPSPIRPASSRPWCSPKPWPPRASCFNPAAPSCSTSRLRPMARPSRCASNASPRWRRRRRRVIAASRSISKGPARSIPSPSRSVAGAGRASSGSCSASTMPGARSNSCCRKASTPRRSSEAR